MNVVLDLPLFLDQNIPKILYDQSVPMKPSYVLRTGHFYAVNLQYKAPFISRPLLNLPRNEAALVKFRDNSTCLCLNEIAKYDEYT